MRLTLKAGLAKMISQDDGDSLCLSCNIEQTLDVTSLRDVDDFDQRVQQAFFVCRDAIDGELRRQGKVVNENHPSVPASPAVSAF